MIPISLSFKLLMIPTGKILMRKWRIFQKISKILWIRLKLHIHNHTWRIQQWLRIIPLLYRLTRILHNWKVDILKKLVTCGLSNMRSAHQNSMNSSSRHNSKAVLLWTSITYTWRHFQIVINSKHSLRPILHILSHSLTTMENWLSKQG